LLERHPAVFGRLSDAFGDRLGLIPRTKDIWCRDYMPVPLGRDQFVQFRYDPDYLRDASDLLTNDGARLLGLDDRCRYSDLVIDGGNVVRYGDTAILTDKVYKENPDHERPRLRDALREVLELERLVIIPKEPYEPLGHADGILRFVDEKTLVVNDYSMVDPAYGRRLNEWLNRAGFKIIPFPYCPATERPTRGDLPSAEGVYINFIDACGKVVLPIYGRAEDDTALELVEKHFGRQVVALACNDLAARGGVLNCATWTRTSEHGCAAGVNH
jgi:agmatine deiminase